jgi:hypothetical protein
MTGKGQGHQGAKKFFASFFQKRSSLSADYAD